MAKVFYLSEIFKFAVEKEIESAELYSKLAENASVTEAKSLFLLLLQEEKKHKDIYSSMLSSIKDDQPLEENTSEYLDYMQEMITAGRSVVPLSNEQMANLKIVLDFALAREKDSVIFYNGLKNFVKAADVSTIDAIIKEESKHIALLSKLKKIV